MTTYSLSLQALIVYQLNPCQAQHYYIVSLHSYDQGCRQGIIDSPQVMNTYSLSLQALIVYQLNPCQAQHFQFWSLLFHHYFIFILAGSILAILNKIIFQ